MSAYYNEFDAFAADWLDLLIHEGHVAHGVVDRRSIIEVQPDDLRGFTQVHLFAGIGGWSLAARLAGWRDDEPLWTGSCPCQPFSSAGKRRGTDDPRHLWPEMQRLVAECRPPVVAGEQVASKAGREWFAGVRADLEALGYAVGGADLCAAGFGAPHIRQRLWWVADTSGPRTRRDAGAALGEEAGGGRSWDSDGKFGGDTPLAYRPTRGLADTSDAEWRALGGTGEDGRDRPNDRRAEAHGVAGARSEVCGLADASGERGAAGLPGSVAGEEGDTGIPLDTSRARNHWAASRWHECLDGKPRRVPLEPSLFPLADGVPHRVGLLRGAGNAIVPEAAAEFLMAYRDARREGRDDG